MFLQKNKIIISVATLVFLSLVFAQADGFGFVLENIIILIQDWLIPLLIGLTILVFLWGILKYAFSKDEKNRKESIAIIINGLIILFVMVSVWGLVWIIASVFGFDSYYETIIPVSPINVNDLIR